nr:MAG TPA: hypothetical protein [Caudoviricetes sp.]
MTYRITQLDLIIRMDVSICLIKVIIIEKS